MNHLNSRELKSNPMKNFIFAVIAIPLTNLDAWKMEAYSSIPANKVVVIGQNLHIQVQKSASPLIYSLKDKVKITGFRIKGEFKSLPRFKDVNLQGQKGFDDFPLRIGMLIPGTKTLSGVKKVFAPDWIKNLYRQLPKGQGLDHISFFNLTQNPNLVGQFRTHPSTDLITETFIQGINKPGLFEITYKLKEPVVTAGLWLSSDGDDTKSDFEVIISILELQTALE